MFVLIVFGTRQAILNVDFSMLSFAQLMYWLRTGDAHGWRSDGGGHRRGHGERAAHRRHAARGRRPRLLQDRQHVCILTYTIVHFKISGKVIPKS